MKKRSKIRNALLTAAICTGLMGGLGVEQAQAAANIPLANPGFEELAEGLPTGWQSEGDIQVVSIAAGHDSANALQHSSQEAYRTSTTQHLENLPEGYYTLTAWIKSSGGQKECRLQVENYGGAAAMSPLTAKKQWHRITIRGIHITKGQCDISLYSDANAGNWVLLDDVSLVKDDKAYELLKGGDISEVPYIEDMGGIYRDAQGNPKECLQVLAEQGFNFARIRNYNNPGKGRGDGSYYCPEAYLNEASCLELARRAKDKGMTLEFSFHYSDYWTNGAIQNIPQAWQPLIEGKSDKEAVAILEQQVYEYTKDMLQKLNAQGTTPEYISLGNEIQSGMLFPYGKATTDDWPQLARFFNAGARAVREVCPESKIILHLDDAGNDWKYDSFFGNCQKYKVDYDIIGSSYYPYFTRKNVEQVTKFLVDVSQRYQKPVVLMETGFSWNPTVPNGYAGQLPDNSDYPMTKEAQRDFMVDLFNGLQSLPDGTGIGDLYWDPVMIEVPGVGWAMRESDDQADVNVVSNTTLFDFQGRILPVMKAYQDSYTCREGNLVHGKILGSGGKTIAHAKVTLQAGGKELSTYTDRYGDYLFGQVPGQDAQLVVESPGYGQGNGYIRLAEPGSRIQVENICLEGASLQGHVVDDYGRPVAGAKVLAQADSRSWSAETAADGSYSLLDVPAGLSLQVAASCDGYISPAAVKSSLQQGSRGQQDFHMIINSGTVSGRIVNPKAAPIADVVVQIFDQAGHEYKAMTDEDGCYTIKAVPAGAYTLWANRLGFQTMSYNKEASFQVNVNENIQGIDMVLPYNVFAIKGKVVDENGQAAAGAVITAQGKSKSYTATSGADGTYEIDRMLADSWYNIQATLGDKPEVFIKDVQGNVGQTTQVDIAFPENIPLVNSGFETWGRDRYDVVGWKVSGTKNSVVVQGPAHTGKLEMAMWKDAAYTSQVSQTVQGLEAGHYILSWYAMNGGGQNSCYIYIQDAAGNVHRQEAEANGAAWTRYVLEADLPAGDAIIGFGTDAKAGNWYAVDDVSLVRVK